MADTTTATDAGETTPSDATDTSTTTGTATATTSTPADAGQSGDPTTLDLRPPADSIKADLVRLGLTYDHGPDPLPDGETWRDYQHGVLAVIPSQSSDTVTISDIGTGIGRTISVAQLKTITKIVTTKSN